ncbi:basic proline-rich protein-like [Cynocephalus volans]|uniref:basic proline-rich protein-like n=1 Tax=Cynocephalus volans TaxID=110931 RepID=UPI002FC9931B
MVPLPETRFRPQPVSRRALPVPSAEPFPLDAELNSQGRRSPRPGLPPPPGLRWGATQGEPKAPRSWGCLTGGRARSGKVKAHRGAPGVASSSPVPEDGDARGGQRRCSRAPPRATRTRSVSGSPRADTPAGEESEGARGAANGRASSTAGGSPPHTLGVRSLLPPGRLERVAACTCTPGSPSPRRRRPRGPGRGAPGQPPPAAPTYQLLGDLRGAESSRRRPPAPASARRPSPAAPHSGRSPTCSPRRPRPSPSCPRGPAPSRPPRSPARARRPPLPPVPRPRLSPAAPEGARLGRFVKLPPPPGAGPCSCSRERSCNLGGPGRAAWLQLGGLWVLCFPPDSVGHLDYLLPRDGVATGKGGGADNQYLEFNQQYSRWCLFHQPGSQSEDYMEQSPQLICMDM